MDKETFVSLYKSLVRSHLEYAAAVWSPHAMGQTEEIEKSAQKGNKTGL